MSGGPPVSPTRSGKGAKDQVARLLLLVPFLHSRDQVGLDEAAAALGVSPKQVVTDLKVLFMCGLPGGYPGDLIDVDLDALEGPDGDRVIRISNADYLSRPLRLTPIEATALIVALRALRATADDDTRPVVDRALGKLEAAAAGAESPQIVADDVDAGRTRLRADLDRAIAAGQQVELIYYVPTRDEESRRTVDPKAVVNAHGFTYLDAWCHSAEAPRLFRLDRIQRAVVLDTPTVTVGGPTRDLSDGFLRPAQDGQRVTLRLTPAAAWVPDYYPVESVRRQRGGVTEVELLVGDPRWLHRLVMGLAPHAEVVAPGELRTAILERAAQTLRLYSDPAHPPQPPR